MKSRTTEQAVRELMLEYARRQYTLDWEGVLRLRSDQAISVSGDSRNPLGQKEYLEMYTNLSKRAEIRMIRPPTIHEAIVSGDLAFVRLTFCTAFTLHDDGETWDVFSRHFFILQRQPDQEWKITHDTWTNVPYDQGEIP